MKALRVLVNSLVVVTVLEALSCPAQAGNIGKKYKENFPNKDLSRAVIMHPKVDVSVEHVLTENPNKLGGDVWGFTDCKITETDAEKDKLKIECKMHHKVGALPAAQHPNEGENEKMECEFDLTASEGELNLQGTETIAELVPIGGLAGHPGPNHFDSLRCELIVDLSANKKQIESYQLRVFLRHEVEPEDDPIKRGDGKMEGGEGVPENVYGAVEWSLDPSSLVLNLMVAISNITLSDVLEARIRAGTPHNPGAIISPVAPAFFEDVDGLGVGFLDVDVPFPAQYVNDLMNNNTFLEIVTPSGNIQGQLVASVSGGIPTVSQWGLIVLMLLFLSAIAIKFCRRRAAHA